MAQFFSLKNSKFFSGLKKICAIVPPITTSTLPRRFGIILEKILDRHERSGIAVQWNGGITGLSFVLLTANLICRHTLIEQGHYKLMLYLTRLNKT